MRFSVPRDTLLKPLQLVAGVVEKRQTHPALANVLLVLEGRQLTLTGTDLEVEIVGLIEVGEDVVEGEITVPAKKLLDICRSLPDGSIVEFVYSDQKVSVKSGRSRFTLSTLPASEFPNIELGDNDLSIHCPQGDIKRLIDRTSFAMAQQDVRYYLNGMLWELSESSIRVVATDGHRLALCTRDIDTGITGEKKQAIIPRKGVLELSRLLVNPEDTVELVLGSNHLRASTDEFVFTSKLVDGKFPDYERVLPEGGDKVILGERLLLKQAFARTAILSNEKYRGVRFLLSEAQLTMTANNPEQEEAEEQISVDYSGPSIEVGFNVSYLLDVANVLSSENIKITLADSNSSALIEEPEAGDSLYVVMPMRL